jgi:hypothetical protein
MKKVTKKAAQMAYDKIPEPGFHIEVLLIMGIVLAVPVVAICLS